MAMTWPHLVRVQRRVACWADVKRHVPEMPRCQRRIIERRELLHEGIYESRRVGYRKDNRVSLLTNLSQCRLQLLHRHVGIVLCSEGKAILSRACIKIAISPFDSGLLLDPLLFE